MGSLSMGVDINVEGDFGKEGEPASRISYTVRIDSPNSSEEVEKLILYIDEIAEVHNTLRKGIAVKLSR